METQTTTNTSLNNKLDFFEYINDGILRVYGTQNEPWFSGKDVATILGYTNTTQAIRTNVDEEDRSILEHQGGLPHSPHNNQGHSVLINESGLYSLILRSNKPEAKNFKRWVTSEVLPSIRKNGTYNNIVINQKELKLKETNDMIELFNKINSAHLSDRDRLLFLDYTRNLFLDAPSNMLELKNDNQEWSISRRLTDEYGVSNTKQVKNLTISFGKIICKEYKRVRNQCPPKRDQFVDGTVRQVNNYYEKDWIEFGDVLLEEYFKDYLTFEEQSSSEE